MEQFSDLYKKLLDTQVEQPALSVEREWLQKAQQESDDYVERVVATCHKLIISLACKIVAEAGKKSHHAAHDSLLSAGYGACCKAVHKFDLNRADKARFSTFAYRHIYGEMLRIRHEDSSSAISVPYKFRPVLNYGIDDSNESDAVKDVLRRAVSCTYTSEGSFGGSKHSEIGQAEDEAVQSLMDEMVCKELEKLPTVQQYVIGHLFGCCGYHLLTAAEITALYDLECGVVSSARLSAMKELDNLLG